VIKILECSDRERMSKKDCATVRAVPHVILASLMFGILLTMTGSSDAGQVLLRFSSSFVIGFAALGIYSFIRRDKGLLRTRITAGILLLTPLMIALIIIPFADHLVPEVYDFLVKFTPFETGTAVMALFLVTIFTLVMMFACHGVISTVVAYFRSYTARIYLSIEKIRNNASDTGRAKISRWIYGIPDIIDIKEVELEPVPDDGNFSLRAFLSLAVSIFALGLMISSYVFLNPIFESTFSLEDAVLVTTVITFFVPVMVIPWSITRDTGAKIKSQARDYYLWKGMRKRIYEGFFTFFFLLSMFAIFLYLGYDLVRTSYTYLAYVSMTMFLSLLFAFIYTNYYHRHFKEGIIENFNEAKK